MGEPLMELCDITDGENRRVYLPGFGGDTSNFIIAAARQGAKTAYFTHVGADVFGKQFLDLWQQEGVDTTAVVQSPEAFTGMYFITYTEAGHEFTYMRKNSAASRVTPGQVPEALIAKAKLFHVSGISQAISETACDAVFRAIQVARENGTLVSYDPNLRVKLWGLERAKAIINRTAALADIFLPSLEDAQQLTGLSEPEEIVSYYHGLGVSVVLLKLGSKGVLVSDGKEQVGIDGFKVDTVDQSGAGDTFDGAFCAKYLEGASLTEAARYANGAAALSTTGYGAVAPIPVREQVEAFLQKQN